MQVPMASEKAFKIAQASWPLASSNALPATPSHPETHAAHDVVEQLPPITVRQQDIRVQQHSTCCPALQANPPGVSPLSKGAQLNSNSSTSLHQSNTTTHTTSSAANKTRPKQPWCASASASDGPTADHCNAQCSKTAAVPTKQPRACPAGLRKAATKASARAKVQASAVIDSLHQDVFHGLDDFEDSGFGVGALFSSLSNTGSGMEVDAEPQSMQRQQAVHSKGPASRGNLNGSTHSSQATGNLEPLPAADNGNDPGPEPDLCQNGHGLEELDVDREEQHISEMWIDDKSGEAGEREAEAPADEDEDEGCAEDPCQSASASQQLRKMRCLHKRHVEAVFGAAAEYPIATCVRIEVDGVQQPKLYPGVLITCTEDELRNRRRYQLMQVPWADDVSLPDADIRLMYTSTYRADPQTVIICYDRVPLGQLQHFMPAAAVHRLFGDPASLKWPLHIQRLVVEVSEMNKQAVFTKIRVKPTRGGGYTLLGVKPVRLFGLEDLEWSIAVDGAVVRRLRVVDADAFREQLTWKEVAERRRGEYSSQPRGVRMRMQLLFMRRTTAAQLFGSLPSPIPVHWGYTLPRVRLEVDGRMLPQVYPNVRVYYTKLQNFRVCNIPVNELRGLGEVGWRKEEDGTAVRMMTVVDPAQFEEGQMQNCMEMEYAQDTAALERQRQHPLADVHFLFDSDLEEEEPAGGQPAPGVAQLCLPKATSLADSLPDPERDDLTEDAKMDTAAGDTGTGTETVVSGSNSPSSISPDSRRYCVDIWRERLLGNRLKQQQATAAAAAAAATNIGSSDRRTRQRVAAATKRRRYKCAMADTIRTMFGRAGCEEGTEGDGHGAHADGAAVMSTVGLAGGGLLRATDHGTSTSADDSSNDDPGSSSGDAEACLAGRLGTYIPAIMPLPKRAKLELLSEASNNSSLVAGGFCPASMGLLGPFPGSSSYPAIALEEAQASFAAGQAVGMPWHLGLPASPPPQAAAAAAGFAQPCAAPLDWGGMPIAAAAAGTYPVGLGASALSLALPGAMEVAVMDTAPWHTATAAGLGEMLQLATIKEEPWVEGPPGPAELPPPPIPMFGVTQGAASARTLAPAAACPEAVAPGATKRRELGGGSVVPRRDSGGKPCAAPRGGGEGSSPKCLAGASAPRGAAPGRGMPQSGSLAALGKALAAGTSLAGAAGGVGAAGSAGLGAAGKQGGRVGGLGTRGLLCNLSWVGKGK